MDKVVVASPLRGTLLKITSVVVFMAMVTRIKVVKKCPI